MATTSKTKAIPEGFHTLTPAIVVHDARGAIAFYQKAFGAEQTMLMPGPDGKIMHAEVRIGDSVLMLNDEVMGSKSPRSLGGHSSDLMLYCEDVDAAFKRAVDAGATVDMPPADMFWGDRFAKVTDPFGHSWQLATHVKDMTPEEMAQAQAAFFASMAQQK